MAMATQARKDMVNNQATISKTWVLRPAYLLCISNSKHHLHHQALLRHLHLHLMDLLRKWSIVELPDMD